MGNLSTTNERKSVQTLTQGFDKDQRPENSVTMFNSLCSQRNPSEVKRVRACEGLIHHPTDPISDTPEKHRKDFMVVMTSSSPPIPRLYLPGRCARVDDEPATVTLEPLEHEWMMCASDGVWDSLNRLLVSDPSLITRKDFVTGFTCLHWAAKLGKHELIAMLANFAKEHQVPVNINARSSAGYTPLHLAAMHNHVEVVKLLVGAFDADIEARDHNGKKACQYLKSDIAQNILDIVGVFVEADVENADTGDTSRWRLSRVIQANFKPLKPSNHNSNQEEESGVLPKESIRRKSSFNQMKAGVCKTRSGSSRTQIGHSTSHF